MRLKEAAVIVAVLATATATTTHGASHTHKDTLTPSPNARPNYFGPAVTPPTTTWLSTTLTPRFITGLPLSIKTPIRHKQGTSDTSSPHTRRTVETLRHKRSTAETASPHKRSTTKTPSRERSSSNTSLRHKRSTSRLSFAVEKKHNYTLPTLLVDLFLPSTSNSNEDDTSKDISSSETFQSQRSEENDRSTSTVSHRLHQSTTTSLEDLVLEAISVNDQKKSQSSEKHPLSSTTLPTKTCNHCPSIRFDDSQPLVISTRHTSDKPKENPPSASEHPDSNPRPLSSEGESESEPTELTLSGTPSRPMLVFTPNKVRVIPIASQPTPTAPKPTLNATPSKPTLRATPSKPTLRATPSKPTLRATPSKPTLRATPSKPALTVAPSNPTLTATSSKPTQIATPSEQAPTVSRPTLIVAPSKPTPTTTSEQEEDHPSGSAEGDLLESTVASILSTSSSVEESEHTSSENDSILSSYTSAENHNATTSTYKADMEESASVIRKYFYDIPFSPALDQFVAPSQASTLLEFLSKPAGKFTEPSEFTGGSLSSLYSSFLRFSTPPPDKYQIPATPTDIYEIPDEYKLDSPFESDLSYDPENFEPDTPTPSIRHPKPPGDDSIYMTSSTSAKASTENSTSGDEEEERPKFPRSAIHNLISPVVSPALYPYKTKPLAPYLYPKSIPHYAFDYLVDDKVQGTYFGHSESREGYKTRGQYYVQLPDGRLQTVSYTANQTGYFPDVAYTGAAKHPVPVKYPIKIPKPLYVPSKPVYGPVKSGLPHKLLYNTVNKPIHPVSLKPLHYTSAHPQTSDIPNYVYPYPTKPKLKPTHIPKPVKVPYIPPVYHPIIITSTTTPSPLSTTHYPAVTSTTIKPTSHTVSSTLKTSPKPIINPATSIYTTSKPSHATSYKPAITIKPSSSPFKPTITYRSHKPIHSSTVPAKPYGALYRPLKSHFKIITKQPSVSIKPSPIPVKSSDYTMPHKTTFHPSKPIPVDPDHPFMYPKYRYEPLPLPSMPTELELKSTHSSKPQTKKYPYLYIPSLLDKKYPMKLKSKSSLASLLSHQHVTPSPYPVTSMFPGPYPPHDSRHPTSPAPLIPGLLFRELHSIGSLLEQPPVTQPPPAPPHSPHPLTPSPISHIPSSHPSHTLPSLGSAEYLGNENVHPSTSSNPHLGHPHSQIPSSPSHILSPHPTSHTLPSLGSAEYLSDQYTHSFTSSHELSLSDYTRRASMLEVSYEAPFDSSEDSHTTRGYDSQLFTNPLYRMLRKDHLGLEAVQDASKVHI